MIKLLHNKRGEISFTSERALPLLRDTLRNAADFPTYAALFRRAKVSKKTAQADTETAFSRVPPIVKSDFAALQRDSFQRVQNREFANDWTSGSTASPILRIASPADEAAEAEAVSRAFRSVGISPQDRVVFFDVGASDIYLFYARVLHALGVFGSCFVKAGSDRKISARDVARFKPTIIISVPSVIGNCLHYLAEEKKAQFDWSIRHLIYISEPISPWVASEARRTLGATCLSFYGTTEVGSVGIECVCSGGIHIPLDLFCPTLLPYQGHDVRLVSKDAYEGPIAWTSLKFRDHPVVKFCVGDLVRITLGGCACGNPAPTMHFLMRLNHAISLFGIKFSYNLFLEEIEHSIGLPINLEIRVLLGTAGPSRDKPAQLCFVIEQRYRQFLNRCRATVLAIHPLDDFVERKLLEIRFQLVSSSYFHQRKTRRLIVRLNSEDSRSAKTNPQETS